MVKISRANEKKMKQKNERKMFKNMLNLWKQTEKKIKSNN